MGICEWSLACMMPQMRWLKDGLSWDCHPMYLHMASLWWFCDSQTYTVVQDSIMKLHWPSVTASEVTVSFHHTLLAKVVTYLTRIKREDIDPASWWKECHRIYDCVLKPSWWLSWMRVLAK